MANGTLPEDGEARLGPVVLPAGKRLHAVDDSGTTVAWVTTEPVADAGRVWSALSDLHTETGLWPVLFPGAAGDITGLLRGPPGIAELDQLDAAQVLASMWAGSLPPAEEELRPAEEGQGEPSSADLRAPFGREFPGLAPAEGARLSMARLYEALASLPSARLGLVAASRPADVLPLVGWSATDRFQTPLPVAAVLRSWEARFGARLLQVGPGAEIRLLVERPPASREAAQRVAAEHFVFCDECGGKGLRRVAEITDSLVNAPIWTFWWD